MEGNSGGEIMRETILQGLEQAYRNLGRMIAEFLPRFLVMLIIIAIGLLVALALKYILRALLRLTKLDRVSEQAGATSVLRLAHLPPMTELLSRSLFWVTWLCFIVVGLGVLGIASLQEQISRLLRFLPEVLVAILVLFLGVAIANFLSRAALLAAVNAGHASARVVSWAIRIGIWILAITMALEELGLARQTVISAFSIVFGATMLGLAIAFGLGGQELARKCLERYLGGSRKEKEKEPEPL
jgi:small-conductance mechanosensitive channel